MATKKTTARKTAPKKAPAWWAVYEHLDDYAADGSDDAELGLFPTKALALAYARTCRAEARGARGVSYRVAGRD